MKPLLKLMLTLALVFASTFIILNLTGLITAEKIGLWLVAAKNTANLYVAATIFLMKPRALSDNTARLLFYCLALCLFYRRFLPAWRA
jgi:uncharacterized membrane protein SirB2